MRLLAMVEVACSMKGLVEALNQSLWKLSCTHRPTPQTCHRLRREKLLRNKKPPNPTGLQGSSGSVLGFVLGTEGTPPRKSYLRLCAPAPCSATDAGGFHLRFKCRIPDKCRIPHMGWLSKVWSLSGSLM